MKRGEKKVENARQNGRKGKEIEKRISKSVKYVQNREALGLKYRPLE
jgi:hypothetical protein